MLNITSETALYFYIRKPFYFDALVCIPHFCPVLIVTFSRPFFILISGGNNFVNNFYQATSNSYNSFFGPEAFLQMLICSPPVAIFNSNSSPCNLYHYCS